MTPVFRTSAFRTSTFHTAAFHTAAYRALLPRCLRTVLALLVLTSLAACGVKSPPKYTYPGSEKQVERNSYPPLPEGYNLPNL